MDTRALRTCHSEVLELLPAPPGPPPAPPAPQYRPPAASPRRGREPGAYCETGADCKYRVCAADEYRGVLRRCHCPLLAGWSTLASQVRFGGQGLGLDDGLPDQCVLWTGNLSQCPHDVGKDRQGRRYIFRG